MSAPCEVCGTLTDKWDYGWSRCGGAHCLKEQMEESANRPVVGALNEIKEQNERIILLLEELINK